MRLTKARRASVGYRVDRQRAPLAAGKKLRIPRNRRRSQFLSGDTPVAKYCDIEGKPISIFLRTAASSARWTAIISGAQLQYTRYTRMGPRAGRGPRRTRGGVCTSVCAGVSILPRVYRLYNSTRAVEPRVDRGNPASNYRKVTERLVIPIEIYIRRTPVVIDYFASVVRDGITQTRPSRERERERGGGVEGGRRPAGSRVDAFRPRQASSRA